MDVMKTILSILALAITTVHAVPPPPVEAKLVIGTTIYHCWPTSHQPTLPAPTNLGSAAVFWPADSVNFHDYPYSVSVRFSVTSDRPFESRASISISTNSQSWPQFLDAISFYGLSQSTGPGSAFYAQDGVPILYEQSKIHFVFHGSGLDLANPPQVVVALEQSHNLIDWEVVETMGILFSTPVTVVLPANSYPESTFYRINYIP